MALKNLEVTPAQLLLDPNNYRFHDQPGYKEVPRKRYADNQVQARVLNTLQTTENFELQALEDSILANGFVALEQIVLEKFELVEGDIKYLVVEGNRRVAAIKTLLEEYSAGVQPIEEEKLSSIQKLSAVEITGSDKERHSFKQTLMAIRHVSGIQEWGAYQQAKLIVELYDEGDSNWANVAQMVGIKASDVARRYRAYKALQQMEEDDEFSSQAKPKLYAYFQEALSAPVVKSWLGWSDETYKADNLETRRHFYELLSPRKVDGISLDPKLNEIRDVRQLKLIVDKPTALGLLLDTEKSLEEAVAAAKTEIANSLSGNVEVSISQALKALRQIDLDSWSDIDSNTRKVWQRLVVLVESIKKLIPND